MRESRADLAPEDRRLDKRQHLAGIARLKRSRKALDNLDRPRVSLSGSRWAGKHKGHAGDQGDAGHQNVPSARREARVRADLTLGVSSSGGIVSGWVSRLRSAVVWVL